MEVAHKEIVQTAFQHLVLVLLYDLADLFLQLCPKQALICVWTAVSDHEDDPFLLRGDQSLSDFEDGLKDVEVPARVASDLIHEHVHHYDISQGNAE